ncbi:MAG: hypothetical protein JSW62_01400 [Thermoplasmatales archaeon]|nr:MAG: hypothetical protein JSW62_01400 [Thermoplasmatales archaeon]
MQDKKKVDRLTEKNQNAIRVLEEKVESLSEDINDLLSLYEIVSVEMNPFVGLSKITRKRLDALEHIDKDFESLKTRIEELEDVIEKIGVSTNDSIVKNKKDDVGGKPPQLEDIDHIIEEALEYIINEGKINEVIDNFIGNLKRDNNVMY